MLAKLKETNGNESHIMGQEHCSRPDKFDIIQFSIFFGCEAIKQFDETKWSKLNSF